MKNNLILFILLAIIISGCESNEDKITKLPYDPEGATITTDKEIFPQHYRTISFSNTNVFVSNEFEGARLNDFYQVNESTYTAVMIPENAPINNSAWYSFKIWAEDEQTIKLNLEYINGNHRYRPKVSSDGINWNLLDTNLVKISDDSSSAIISLSVNEDTLWFSAQELITSKVYRQWIDELSEFTYVNKSIIDSSSEGRPIYKLEIAENSSANKYLFVISRQHPPEVTGYFAMKAFVETIAGDSETAKIFRTNYRTVVIPLVNPDGIDNGHWRHNNKGVDLNRDWVEFNQPEPGAVKNEVEQILSDPDNAILFFIDFHSTTEDVFYTLSLESLISNDLSEDRKKVREEGYGFVNTWLQNLQARLPEYNVNVIDTLSQSTSPTSDRWIMKEYDVPAFTYEVGDETERELIKQVAEGSAEELMNLLLEKY
ncbi:MAG: hypothetical protein DRQ13_08285 [Ignavibacteriae bacterium]|nr:MAG: hypothetical protein DRQ13_08285 [Ignavibacteriota bacterium]